MKEQVRFIREGYILTRFRGQAHHVDIPGDFRVIGDRAFQGNDWIHAVTIPEGIREIRESAFRRCSRLEAVTIPEGVKEIGGTAFEKCRSLREVTLPVGLQAIGEGAFSGCTNLESINFPDSLKTIGKCAFRGCPKLKLANRPGCVPEIGEYAFEDCDPQIANAMMEAADRIAAMYSGLVVTVTNLRRHPNADRLQCTEILGHNVIVGDSCKPGDRLVFFPAGGKLDEEFIRKTPLLCREGDNGGTYLHPVTGQVRRIRLHGEVSEALALPLEVLEEYTDIHALKDGDTVSVPGGRPVCRTYIPATMNLDIRKKTLIRYSGRINSTPKVCIPWGTEIIGSRAFAHSRRITEVVIPETVTTIRGRAFYDCPNLKRVVIPDSVLCIEDEAFAHCGNLTDDILPDELKRRKSGIFAAKDFEIEDGKLVKYKGEMRDVFIPEGVTEIGKYAFINNRVVESVMIPPGVERIGYSAFADCRRLRKVSIPKTVRLIDDGAFLRCKTLHEVSVPPGVERIGAHAFGEYYSYRYDAHFPYEVYRRYGNFRMYCAKGSAAELYALEHHVAYHT